MSVAILRSRSNCERDPFQSRPCRLTGQATWAGLKGAGRLGPSRATQVTQGAKRPSNAASPGAAERPGAFLPVEATTKNVLSDDMETKT